MAYGFADFGHAPVFIDGGLQYAVIYDAVLREHIHEDFIRLFGHLLSVAEFFLSEADEGGPFALECPGGAEKGVYRALHLLKRV